MSALIVMGAPCAIAISLKFFAKKHCGLEGDVASQSNPLLYVINSKVQVGPLLLRNSAPSYEVYHFQTVAGLNGRFIPLGPWNYFKVAFDRHTIGRHLKPVHQPVQCKTFRDF